MPGAAAATSRRAMTMAMLLSLEACEIMNTFTPAAARAPKVRPAMPGTPSMPRPSTVTNASSRIVVTALTAPGPGALVVAMSVPG